MKNLINPKEILFENPFVTVYHTPKVTQEGLYTVVRTRGGGGASIMAIIPPSENHPTSRVLLLKQHRPPINGPSWEFPAGALDEGEDGATAAAREFTEETGITVDTTRLISLGGFHSSPTIAQDYVNFYAYVLPKDFDKGSVTIQEEEIDGYAWFTVSELMEEITQNPNFSVTLGFCLIKARKAGLLEPLNI